MTGQAAPIAAQSVYCVPPLVPLMPGERTTQIEYRDELSTEYARYFDEAQTYLNCLVAAQNATRTEIERAIRDYSALLDLPRTQ